MTTLLLIIAAAAALYIWHTSRAYDRHLIEQMQTHVASLRRTMANH